MSTIQAITEKVTELTKLALGFVAQAAASLVNTAEKLSLEEIDRRLDGALGALRGDKEPTAQKTPLEIAQEMIYSYEFNEKTRVSTFTVPAGVTDVDAMKALNEYFRKNQFDLNRDAVQSGDLDWYQDLPLQHSRHCQERDYSQSRQITITGVVKGTNCQSREYQLAVLKRKALVFSDPRDQALAAAIHACKHNGADLFQGLSVRCSVPGVVLGTVPLIGFGLSWFGGDRAVGLVAASGSPSPKSK